MAFGPGCARCGHRAWVGDVAFQHLPMQVSITRRVESSTTVVDKCATLNRLWGVILRHE
jgi:hypothetical protein